MDDPFTIAEILAAWDNIPQRSTGEQSLRFRRSTRSARRKKAE
jgi:hypothetical protein